MKCYSTGRENGIRREAINMEPGRNKTAFIAQWLMKEITEGRFRTGDKIPSEYELAERFSVNKKTANKAVSELVVRKLVERRRGGGGSVVCGNPALLKGKFVVFMSGRISYYSNLLHGFQEGAFHRGYDLYFYSSPDVTDFTLALNRLKVENPSGVIVTHLHEFPADLPFPVLWVNNVPADIRGCNLVRHDNRAGGRMLAEHLVGLGHRRIVYVAQNNVEQPLLERCRGFLDVLKENGIEVLSIELFSDASLSAREFTDRLLRRFPEMTAIACDGDHIAMSILLALRESGIRVPEDLSLTGFSCLPEVQSLVRITSVDERPRRMGAYAAELLADLIEGRTEVPVSEIFSVEFSAGRTTGPARNRTLP